MCSKTSWVIKTSNELAGNVIASMFSLRASSPGRIVPSGLVSSKYENEYPAACRLSIGLTPRKPGDDSCIASSRQFGRNIWIAAISARSRGIEPQRTQRK